jgi:hypothetical protein
MIPIPDINKYEGTIPTGHELVVYERGTDPADGAVLYGFDEVHMYREFRIKNPEYCFLKLA